eukprot:scaffold28598_cov128-Skeletonema_marinoi.AAC.2
MAQSQLVGNRFLRANVPFWISAIVVSSICSYHLGYNDSNPMEMKVNQKEEEVTTTPTPAAVDISNIDFLTKGEDVFSSTAKSLSPVTDKVTTHSYQIMYGRFLLPYYQQNPSMKMLEIGLGCNMNYGPGASVAVWKKLFPEAELWEAEFDAECVEKHRNETIYNVLTGDQGDDAVLDSWVQLSGGNFDVVIDDGGHQNCQIWHSFLKLWPTVKPGGLYFIEDLQVGRWPQYRKATTDKCSEDLIVMDKLKEYMDVLIHADQKQEFAESNIEFIFCQHEACVLGKKK